MKFLQTHIFRFVVGLDQAFNPLLLGGSENVTISSQLGYNDLILGRDVWMRKAIDWVFWHGFDVYEHCWHSLLREIYEFPPEDEIHIRAALAQKGIQ